jgi:MEMO1 family protein
MFGPSDPSVRSPAVAGMFYPAEPAECQRVAAELIAAAKRNVSAAVMGAGVAPAKNAAAGGKSAGSSAIGPDAVAPGAVGLGAIVPHAGWICSGSVAAQSIASLAAGRPNVDLVVVFGAIHTPGAVERAVLDSHERWSVPGQESPVLTEMRGDLAASAAKFVVDDRFHVREHAVEVELPLIQVAWPAAKILPIESPPIESAVEVGAAVARAVDAAGLSAVYLASSDLTHYGPNYRFAPAGVGTMAIAWAMENDRRILRIVTDLTPEKIVPEARKSLNACGAGAIASMIAACLEMGARRAVVLRHTNSFETLAAVAPQPPDNAVGYAAVWVG